jgi:hypothetical protein
LLPCAGNYLPYSVFGSDVVSRQSGLYSRGNSALCCAVRLLDCPQGIRRIASRTPRRKNAGPGVIVAFNEASVVLAYEYAEIVIEPGPAVHQVVFPLQQVTQPQCQETTGGLPCYTNRLRSAASSGVEGGSKFLENVSTSLHGSNLHSQLMFKGAVRFQFFSAVTMKIRFIIFWDVMPGVDKYRATGRHGA